MSRAQQIVGTDGSGNYIPIRVDSDGKLKTTSGSDVSSPVNPTDATSVFVAAAATAKTAGRNYIRVAPGHYNCPGMTPTDMQDVYIIGNGVTFTNSTYVYPFTEAEFAGIGVQRGNEGVKRGAIAFELDDALMAHWTMVFPWSKKMNVPIGTVWHEGQISAPWVKEAWRHGWEIISHGYSAESFTAISLAEVENQCIQSLNVIEAITGSRENVSFVYPQHHRTPAIDAVVSKYFVRGRGIASWSIKPDGAGDTWLTSAAFLDPFLDAMDGNTNPIHAQVKNALDTVAMSNGRLVLYFHGDTGNLTKRLQAMTKIVNYARSLGIHIDKPSAVNGKGRITSDPYLSDANHWKIQSSATQVFSRDTTQKYHGTHSIKISPHITWGNGELRHEDGSGGVLWVPNPAKSGHFSVYRVSYRIHAPSGGTVSSSASSGITLGIAAERRVLDGTFVYPGLKRSTGTRFPAGTATAIPTMNWERVSRTVILGSDIAQFVPYLTLWNLDASSNEMWLDEILFEYRDSVPSVTYSATLNGTTGRAISTFIYDVASYAITITPRAAVAGRLYVTTDASDVVTVYSTDAADTTQTVDITIHSKGTMNNYNWVSTGA